MKNTSRLVKLRCIHNFSFLCALRYYFNIFFAIYLVDIDKVAVANGRRYFFFLTGKLC